MICAMIGKLAGKARLHLIRATLDENLCLYFNLECLYKQFFLQYVISRGIVLTVFTQVRI